MKITPLGRLRKWGVAALAAAALVVSPALALAESNATSLVYIQQEVRVYLKGDANLWDTASLLTQGIGRIATKHDDGSFTFALRPGMTLEEAIERLEGRASVARVEASPPDIPVFNSIKSVSRLSATIEAYEHAYEAYKDMAGEEGIAPEDENGEAEDEVPGLDFIRGYEQWVRERAYPNDWFDNSVYHDFAMSELNKVQTRAAMGNPTWSFMGPTNLDQPYTIYYGQRPINGRVNAIAFHPTDAGTYYIGAPIGGVWKTTDNGVNWTPLSDTWPLMGVNALAVSPANGDLVLAGTGDFQGFDVAGFGIMRSTDGGATWTNVGAAQFASARIRRIVFDPDNNNIVYATAGKTNGGDSSNRGIYRSTDAGLTWTEVITNNLDWSELTYGVDNGNGRPIYAGGPGNLWRSYDQGANWTSLSLPGGGGTVGFAASPKNPGVIYYLDSGTERVYKSTNEGASFTNVTGSFPGGYNWSQAWYDWHIYCSYRPKQGGGFDDVVYIGLIDIVHSPDGGTTWRSTGGGKTGGGTWNSTYSNTAITHNDQHSAAVDPNNPARILIGNDGGIYELNFIDNGTDALGDDNVNFRLLSKNLGITQFYRIAVHPTIGDYVLGGTQDNASPHSFGDLANWGNPGAGDGCGCAINPFNPQQQYESSQFQNISRTNNGFNSQFDITPNWSGQSRPFIGILRMDENNGRYVYANTQYLNRYDAQTGNWTLRLGNTVLGNSLITAVEVAPGNSDMIMTGSGGRLHLSTDFGATWTRVDRVGQGGGMPNATVTSININPNDNNDVLITLSGAGVYRCLDVSVANPVWINVSGDLPSGIPCNTIERHPDDEENHWYVGTDVGVFMTQSAGGLWVDITTPWGLPRTQVNEMVLNPTTRLLTAGTFGRGMWQLDLDDQVAGGLDSVTVDPTTVVAGDPSTGTVTLNSPAPQGGSIVTLASDDMRVTVPLDVTIPAGQTTATFPIQTADSATDYSAIISGTLNGQTRSATLNAIGVPSVAPVNFFTGNIAVTSDIGMFPDDLVDSDDLRLHYNIYNAKLPFGILVLVYEVPNPMDVGSLELKLEHSSNPSKVASDILLFNFTTEEYDPIQLIAHLPGDRVYKLDIPSLDDYMDPSGQVVIQFRSNFARYTRLANWQVNLDQAVLRVRPIVP